MLEIFLSILVVSLVSLIGIFSFFVNFKFLEKNLGLFVAFAIGSLLGGVFLHFLPELSETGISPLVSFCILLGFLSFFILEKFLYWHHCHDSSCKEHSNISYMIFFGDMLHNFLDGIFIAGSYLLDFSLGLSATIAVVFHEVPQEIGDFGVLVKGGFSRWKALLYNFISSLSAFLGAIVFLFFSSFISGIEPLVVAFTAGSFVYIAASDLIPELHKNLGFRKAVLELFFICLGILVMYFLVFLEV